MADDSIAVEIWGHLYAEKFANAIKAIVPVKLIDGLAERICTSCEVINIGNRDNDSNLMIRRKYAVRLCAWRTCAWFKVIISGNAQVPCAT